MASFSEPGTNPAGIDTAGIDLSEITVDETRLLDFKRRCLTDTGYLCRNLLGWNYDENEDGKHVNVGQGGIYSTGSHARMTGVFDNKDSHYKLVLTPRNSRKSTIAQGFCVRQILSNPNVRILYGMKNDKKVWEKAEAIRKSLTRPEITALFGDQVGAPWQGDRFTVSTRTQPNLQEATFNTFSLESMPTGGHYEIIIIDDLIDMENCRTEEALLYSKKVAELVQPLMTVGGYLIWIGTVYAEEDLYWELENSPLYEPPLGEKVVLGAGVRVIKTKEGRYDLIEEPEGLTFPHLTLSYLKAKLHGMMLTGSVFSFCCQYLNVRQTAHDATFRREYFRPVRWSQTMKSLSGYLLTDTATSLRKEGCYSVLAYIGLDDNENIYLLDLDIGHWKPHEFVEHFFTILDKWQEMVNHCGEVWEKTSLVTVFRSIIDQVSANKKLKLKTIEASRSSDDSKLARIEMLQRPMVEQHFWILTSVPGREHLGVPESFTDLGGRKLLWSPEGHRDPRSGINLPAGELVDEFLNYRTPNRHIDIADCLAMAVETEKTTRRRRCVWRPPPPEKRHTALRTYPGPADAPNDQLVDWWETTRKQLQGEL